MALLFSGISFFLSKEVSNYSLSTNISINGGDIEADMLTVIKNSLSHPSILEQAQGRLGITSSDYSVLIRKGNDPGIIQLIILGPDSNLLTNLSNEIFHLGKTLIETVFEDVELRNLEISSPTVVPQSTKSNVNWILNSILGAMLGGMLSVFYIFIVYFISPNIVQDNEFESLFNANILGRFVGNPKKQTIRSFFEVR